jgi:hypothetical protein
MLCGIDAKLRSMLIIVFNYNSVENSRQQKKRETVRERERKKKRAIKIYCDWQAIQQQLIHAFLCVCVSIKTSLHRQNSPN